MASEPVPAHADPRSWGNLPAGERRAAKLLHPTAMSGIVHALPALIAECAARGLPVTCPDPGTEHGRRLLEVLGVAVIPAIPLAFQELVAAELADAHQRALETWNT